MWHRQRWWIAGLVAGVVGVASTACATSRGQRIDTEGQPVEMARERLVGCVVTEMPWAQLRIKQCYVEIARDDLPKEARIPFVATSTRTPIGVFGNPLTVRFGTDEERGFVISFSTPDVVEPRDPKVDEADEMRRELDRMETEGEGDAKEGDGDSKEEGGGASPESN